jgi:protein-tyrosine phosphatase
MPFSLLFVCTANQCRSPLAEALARRRFAGRDVIVRSAGLLPGGESVPEIGIHVARDLGLDLSAHISRRFTSELAADADLVLAMTNSQARDLVTTHAELWPRIFTVKSFVRWANAQQTPAAGLSRDWLEAAGSAREMRELLGSSQADEVEDPMGRPPRVWRRVARELSGAIDQLVALMPVARGIPEGRSAGLRR